MSSAKAGYKGDGGGTLLRGFSDATRAKLRDFCPTAEDASASDFVGELLSEAWWAKAELHWQQFESTKPEIRAEHVDLLKNLRDLSHKLRNLSPDFDRLLGIDADPVGCATEIDELICHVERAAATINQLPAARKTQDKQYGVALELAIRILRVLNSYGIRAAATANTYTRLIDIREIAQKGGDDISRYVSDAINVLKTIGDDIGLVRSEITWRDIIIAARGAADDIK